MEELARSKSGQDALCTVRLILHNVLKGPDNPKYKRVNMSGKAWTNRIAPHPEAKLALEAAGFTVQGGVMVLIGTVDISRIQALHDTVDTTLKKAQLAAEDDDDIQIEERRTVRWVPYERKIPSFAVQGGREANGGLLYIARGVVNGAVCIGKVGVNSATGLVGSGGKEVPLDRCEVLVCDALPSGQRLRWKSGWQSNAVRGGHETDGRPLCVARAAHEGGLHPGHAAPHLGCCQFGYGGVEQKSTDFETLVVAPVGDSTGTEAEVSDDGTRPKMYPLFSMHELRDWVEGADILNVSTVEREPRCGGDDRRRQKLLVCHDMKGGYLEGDAYPQGSKEGDQYRFRWWQWCDVFVYFSHHRVTIPPAAWTNVAHRHGTAVLGTVILEGESGIAECIDLLASRASCEHHAKQLARIAGYYQFDGWLLNFENAVQPAMMDNLVHFCATLKAEMRKVVRGSLVIWYDSVAYPSGSVVYQNRLAPANQPFFDAVDGLFTNYFWDATMPFQSVQAAGERRRYDVYTGIDVFGRKTYGGGGWTTSDAFEVIAKAGTSVALFAPGWTYEGPHGDQDRREVDDKFWAALQKFCNGCLTVRSLPFRTNFDQGTGKKMFVDGECVHDAQWFNICQQDVVPRPYPLALSSDATAQYQFCQEVAYAGGTSLVLEGSLDTMGFAVFRLLSCCIPIKHPVTLTLVIADAPTEGPDRPPLCLLAVFTTLVGGEAGPPLAVVLHTTDTLPDEITSLPLNHVKADGTYQVCVGWTGLQFTLDGAVEGTTLASVSVICGNVKEFFNQQLPQAARAGPTEEGGSGGPITTFNVRIGEVTLVRTDADAKAVMVDQVFLEDVVRDPWRGTQSMTISWTYKEAPHPVAYCNIIINGEYVGRAHTNAYRLCGWEPPSGATTFAVGIQCVDTCGNKLLCKEIPHVDLPLR